MKSAPTRPPNTPEVDADPHAPPQSSAPRWSTVAWLSGLTATVGAVVWIMLDGRSATWLGALQLLLGLGLGGAALLARHRRPRPDLGARSLRDTSASTRALDSAASGLAHDINNLMAVIQVNRDLLEAELSKQDLDDPQQVRRILERIQRAIHRGEALIRRMLGVVELDHLDDEELAAKDLVLATIDLIRPSLPAHIRIVTDSLEARPFWGDRAQLEQVLFNLVTNAIHAIGEKPGEIRVEVGERPPDFVVVTVNDSGCGIAAETLEHIFEPYFTTKPTGVGTGLGLAQVQRIVTRHAGKIDLHSRVGKGTTISVALPISRPATPDLRHPDPGVSGVVGVPGPRVLLVEDEDDIAEVIVAALPAAQIHRFRTAEPALRAISRARKPYDLLLLDLNLPRGSGRTVFRAARKKWLEAPILVITGYIDSEELVSLLAEPGTRCLRKPFSLRELRAAADRMIGFPSPLEGASPNSHLGHR